MRREHLPLRTEHRGFVRYQRSDYLLSGRVLAVGRKNTLRLWTDTGLHRLKLLPVGTSAPVLGPFEALRTLLLRRLTVRVVGCDSQRVLLARLCRDRGLDSGGRYEVAPRCPECGRTMELRQAHTGPARGSLIWGCSRYPLCQVVRHLA